MPTPKLDDTVLRFFSSLVEQSQPQQATPICYIVVTHTAIDIPEFLQALTKTGRVAKVIFKSSHHNPEVAEEVDTLFPQTIDPATTKESLRQNPESAIRLIEETVKPGEKCIILDIGGYFAPALPLLSQSESAKSLLLGIVEDTENGHQKYEKTIASSDIPVCSVARSEQKKTEDYNVGKSIAQSTEAILRRFKKRPENFECVGVIGFGKIGRSIAHHVRDKHVKQLLVHDHDPCILMQAESLDYSIASRADILSKCDLIFCASGNHSITTDDIELLSQPDVYFASCTSADDEFSIHELGPYFVTEEKDHVRNKIYTRSNGSRVTFLADGNAVNFALKSNVLGHYIRGVQAAIYLSALKLLQGVVKTGEIFELPRRDELFISRLYLNIFNQLRVGTVSNLSKPHEPLHLPCSEHQLNELDRLFNAQHTDLKIAYIHSEPGLGRKTLSQSYAWNQFDTYDILWRLDADNHEESIQSLAVKLGINFLDTPPIDVFKKILVNLASQGKRFFFIATNIHDEDNKLLQAIQELPRELASQSDGRILLIGNQPIASLASHSLQLLPISAQEAESIENEATTAEQRVRLAHILEGNLLVIKLALRYIKQTIDLEGVATTEEINAYLSGIDSSTNKEATVIGLSLKACNQFIWGKRKVASELMLIVSLIHYDHIHDFILSKIREIMRVPQPFFCMVINMLLDYGLIRKMQDPSGQFFYTLDKIIKLIILEIHRESPWCLAKNFRQASATIEALFKYDLHNRTLQDSITYLPQLKILPHVRALLDNAENLSQLMGGPLQYHCQIEKTNESNLVDMITVWERSHELDSYIHMLLLYVSNKSAWYFIGQNAQGHKIKGYLADLPTLQAVRTCLQQTTPGETLQTEPKKLQYTLLSILIPSLGHSESFVNASASLFCKLGSFFQYQMRNTCLAQRYFSAARKAISAISAECTLTQREAFLLIIATHGEVLSQLCLVKLHSIEKTKRIKLYNQLQAMITSPKLKEYIDEISRARDGQKPSCLALFISNLDRDYLTLCSVDMKVALSYIIRYQAVAQISDMISARLLYDKAHLLLAEQSEIAKQMEAKPVLQPMLAQLRAAIYHAQSSHLLCSVANEVNEASSRVTTIELAIEHLKAALAIRKEPIGGPRVDQARSLSKLGSALLMLNTAKPASQDDDRLVEAMTYCSKALAIQRSTLPNGHPDMSFTKGVIAKLSSCQVNRTLIQ